MSPINQQSSSKERFWRTMVEQWRGSGLSVRAFCARRSLSEPSFYAWRRTLQERDAAQLRFVPVKVVAQETASTADDTSAAANTLELVLCRGRRLRVRPGFDGPTLTRLLALLEEGRP
jgi:transposase-like protein